MSPVHVETRFLQVEPLDLPTGDIRDALLTSAPEGSVLLGHADDGVIWGVIRQGTLQIAADYDLPGAQLRRTTLQDFRLFDDDVEIRGWRNGGDLSVRRISEADCGTRFEAWQDTAWAVLRQARGNVQRQKGFALLRGPSGQVHAPPICGGLPFFLRVRHYFEGDEDTGMLRLAEHRWRRLTEGNQSEGN